MFYFIQKARASSICKRFLFPESNDPPKVATPKGCYNSESNEGRYYRNSRVVPVFLHNFLPVLNFYSDETFFKEIWSNWQRKMYTVDTMSFSDLFQFFSSCINWPEVWRPLSLFLISPFLLSAPRNPFHSSIFHRSTLEITYGRGSFAVHFGNLLRSRDHLPLGIICGTVQGASSRGRLFSFPLN